MHHPCVAGFVIKSECSFFQMFNGRSFFTLDLVGSLVVEDGEMMKTTLNYRLALTVSEESFHRNQMCFVGNVWSAV